MLRSIKELEFDHAMGKVSDQDFAEMGLRLRTRAAGLMRQLDAGADYSTQIEQELVRRLSRRRASPPPRRAPTASAPSAARRRRLTPASAASADSAWSTA